MLVNFRLKSDNFPKSSCRLLLPKANLATNLTTLSSVGDISAVWQTGVKAQSAAPNEH